MVARLLEDAFYFGRFIWFFARGPEEARGIGFVKDETRLTIPARVRWAWRRTTGQIR